MVGRAGEKTKVKLGERPEANVKASRTDRGAASVSGCGGILRTERLLGYARAQPNAEMPKSN